MSEDNDALKIREETCAGCGASIWVPDPMSGVGPGRRPAAPLTLGASVDVWVCGKDDMAHRYVPLIACKRKAREKRALCPGCDDTGIEPGDLCEKCSRMIEVGRATVDAEPLVAFHLRPFNFVGDAFRETDDIDKTERERLILLLARAIAGRGAEFSADPNRPHRAWAKVTEAQSEALEELVPALREAFDAARRAGHAAGRSILFNLATGRLSAEQLDATTREVDEERGKGSHHDDFRS